MRLRAGRVALALMSFTALLALTTQASAAAPSPAWSIESLASPSNFKPGDESGLDTYVAYLTNSGGEESDGGPITIVDTLPAGLSVERVRLTGPRGNFQTFTACSAKDSGPVAVVSCEVTESLSPESKPATLFPGNQLVLEIQVKTPPSASGTLTNRIEVQGGGADPAAGEAKNEASEEDAQAGFEEFSAQLLGADGKPQSAADSHPYASVTSFAVNTAAGVEGGPSKFVPADGDLKEIEVALPPGLVGNPTAVERCKQGQLVAVHGTHVSKLGVSLTSNECPAGSAVGLAAIQQLEGGNLGAVVPIYNLVPPKGMPAQLGFEIFGLPTYINTRVRSDGDYGVTAYLRNVTQIKRITASRITIWGVPWDESHDTMRAQCGEFEVPCSADGTPRPFLRLPSSCRNPLLTTMSFTTWAQPPTGASDESGEPAPGECERPDFSPSIEAKPTTNVADAPSGLHVDVHLPQRGNEDPEGLGEADLKDAKVTLPEGLVVNPSSADGLDGCSPSQIGLSTPIGQVDAHFNTEEPSCPEASRIGTVEVDTPLVDHPLPGAVYLALPHENPLGSLLAIYIAVSDPETGVVVKLAGKVEADPVTGQLSTTVSESPQLPFEDFKLDFFEGARAPLRTPSVCGTHVTTATFTPWTAPEGSSAFPTGSFETTTPAAGRSSCPTSSSSIPAAASFEAGTQTPTAGAFSPLIVNLSRADGNKEFGKLTLKPPPGLLAKLAGIPYCSDASLASASNKSGRSEEASPSCPGASQVGTATVGAGAGPAPYHVTGKVYLAGPYKGAPLSLAVITPAVAGPFDLGTVVVRTALHVDPATTQITAQTDPIPHILQGIPLDVRSISVRLDHSGWGLNPTSCDPFSFDGTLQSVLGGSSSLQNRFQVGDCARLGFKPKLQLSLKGKTKRTAFPALHAVYTPKPGDANLKSLVLRFPRSEFIEQGHFRTICTRVQWAAGAGGGSQCPEGSIYGQIKASTPLLDKPLEGPVYLRSSDHNLPDVVFALKGQVDAEVSVRIDSVKGGLRASIEDAPDVPISKVVLDMQGGQKGLFVNSRDICAHAYKASVALGAQSGKEAQLRPVMKAKCDSSARGRKKGNHVRK